MAGTPGEIPTKELQTFLSSRIKTLKNKQAIREDRNPEIPDSLLEMDKWFDEEVDCVVTSVSEVLALPREVGILLWEREELPQIWRLQMRVSILPHIHLQFQN